MPHSLKRNGKKKVVKKKKKKKKKKQKADDCDVGLMELLWNHIDVCSIVELILGCLHSYS